MIEKIKQMIAEYEGYESSTRVIDGITRSYNEGVLDTLRTLLRQAGLRKCANCGKEKPVQDMKACMDYRQMHIYVCDSKCMVSFYERDI